MSQSRPLLPQQRRVQWRLDEQTLRGRNPLRDVVRRGLRYIEIVPHLGRRNGWFMRRLARENHLGVESALPEGYQ